MQEFEIEFSLMLLKLFNIDGKFYFNDKVILMLIFTPLENPFKNRDKEHTILSFLYSFIPTRMLEMEIVKDTQISTPNDFHRFI